MTIYLNSASQQKTSAWAGGTTTELAIYPEESSYLNRDFLFRISTAKVEIEKSTFTSLPDVSRIIMALDGTLILQHKNKYVKTLNKFDTDCFEGNWETSSIGRVTDFNLMLRNGCKGEMKSLILKQNDLYQEIKLTGYNFVAYYVFKGSVTVNVNDQKYMLSERDFVLIEKQTSQPNIVLSSSIESELVISYVKLV